MSRCSHSLKNVQIKYPHLQRKFAKVYDLNYLLSKEYSNSAIFYTTLRISGISESTGNDENKSYRNSNRL